MSSWGARENAHKSDGEHRGNLRQAPFQASCLEIDSRCGGSPIGKCVPIWKSRGGFVKGVMRPFSVAGTRLTSMRDRWRTRFNRNEGENVMRPRSQAQEDTISPPTVLCRVDESSISAMALGDIFLIEQLEAADLSCEPTFHAILACPLCGSQVLISAAQYFGSLPVICGARACSGFFRIIDEGRFAYLPVN